MTRFATSPILAAALSGALLVVAILAGGLTSRDVPGTDAFHARIRDAVRSVPMVIGDWVGEDAEPEPAAIEILAPVVIMQRLYRNAHTGETISLLLIYCDDTRNLMGHYPPACYPNARGWSLVHSVPEPVEMLQRDHPATNYAFSRVVEGVERDLSVLNFMVSPSPEAPMLPDMDALTRAEPTRFTPGLGAGQVQILGLDSLQVESREAAKREFLRAIEPVIRVIAEGA